MNMIFVNVIKSYRDVVAICDKELLGKKFEEGKFQLDVKENFYKGELVSEEEAIKISESFSKEDSTFNIVGENSIKVALKTRMIEKEDVGEVEGIPFALVLL
ncbi:MAG TPA: DUF424 family protein [Candidatus Pacearchaeota archaeon]|nr:DUF424 family protein [Candidatus Pacearchaeota archaeon]